MSFLIESLFRDLADIDLVSYFSIKLDVGGRGRSAIAG